MYNYGMSRLTITSPPSNHFDPVESVALSPGGSRLASAHAGGEIVVWNIGLGPPSTVRIGHDDGVFSVAFSPDGLGLASGSWDGTVRVWDGTSGASVTTLEGHSDLVESVAFSPDGSRLASASSDKTVRLWDSRTDHVAPSAHFDTRCILAGRLEACFGASFK
jgi:WD40 repeat protein